MTADLRLIGKTATDYFAVLCEACEAPVRIKYLGWDPAVPHIEARCEQCGRTAKLKLSGAHWSGLPPKPHK